MSIQSTDLYVRTCQECGVKQESKPCVEYKGESWKDKACKSCKSPALDYGSFGWSRTEKSNLFYRSEDQEE